MSLNQEKKIQIGNKVVGLEEKITPENEEYVYGYLMEVLTGGLYPNKFDVIREYVQNSFDAVIEWKKNADNEEECPIKIDIETPSITIFDSGTGMTRERINQYRYIGFSKKEMGGAVGFQGIGKLAGITAANKLIVTTSPYGIAEKYRLVFDAAKMLDQIRELREDQQNITIKKLISNHTDISTEDEDEELHYTFVELNHIREDSKSLFDEDKLIQYLSKTISLPFNPEFKFANEIEEKLRTFVNDYDWVNVLVNGIPIFKPYREDIKSPNFIHVFADSRMIAYAWYCENKVKGQLIPKEDAGLFFRKKNFRIGTNYLPRNTIWKYSDHLAFHFCGEIHICDNNILPTASRNDFKQNKARNTLYERCEVISKTLSKARHEESEQRQAYNHIKTGEKLIDSLKTEIEEKKIPTELVDKRISDLFKTREEIKKRINKIPSMDTETKMKAHKIIGDSEYLLKEIKKPKTIQENKIYQITDKLSLSSESSKIYEIIIRTLIDFFIDEPDEFERILKKIHLNLENEFKK